MGTLFVVATPIGNLDDISIRAIKTLFSADIVACEDTRRTGLLLSELKKRYGPSFPDISFETPTLTTYYDQIERNKTPELLELLALGKNIALVSDAGTPLVNDPGYILVSEARKRNIPVVSIPGASALLAALTSSGLPADKFTFLGYPPEKTSHRLKLFDTMKQHSFNQTFIFYCAPHKLVTMLSEMKETFGDIDITVCRELTKIHEEIWTGKINEALQYFAEPKGEFVVLFDNRA